MQSPGSGIIQDTLVITPCPPDEATHFAIFNKKQTKYLVNLNSGYFYLKKTIAAYNIKLLLLLTLLPFIPWKILAWARIGQFVHVKLRHEIEEYIPEHSLWNILIGAYDKVQKIVFQLFPSTKNNTCTFIKVGNKKSDHQMSREICFLRRTSDYQTFSIPSLKHSKLISEGSTFNIQVTDEIQGAPVPAILSKELYDITKEIAGKKTFIDNEAYTFSHGDFAPWNLRKSESGYIVFDWEHYGLRPQGYDAAYFIIITEITLNKHNFNDAFNIAVHQLRQLDPNLKLNKELIFEQFKITTKTIQF